MLPDREMVMFGSNFSGRSLRAIFPLLLGILFATVPFTGTVFASDANGAAAPADDAAARQAKIHELMMLLAQQWLDEQGTAKAPAPAPPEHELPVVDYLSSGASGIHDQIIAFTEEIPHLPDEFRTAIERIDAIDWKDGLWCLVIFVVVVTGTELLFRKITTRMRRRLDALPAETAAERVNLIAARFVLRLAAIAVFGITSVGLLLLLDWQPIRRATILGVTMTVVLIRVAGAFGNLVLAPDREDLRTLPLQADAADFWWRRLIALASWLAINWFLIQECLVLGISNAGAELIGYTLGIGPLVIALEAIWRRPRAASETDGATLETRHFAQSAGNVGLSIGAVLLWVLWVASPGVTSVDPSFWLVLVLMVLPVAIKVSRQAIEHLLRSPISVEAGAPPSVIGVCLEHASRALLIIGAVAVLSYGWDVDLVHLAARDTFFARLVRGILTTVIILLLADVFWQILKAAIDTKLAETVDLGQPNSEEARRHARMQTLLPIFRNVSLIIVVVVATMMALAELGVQIGPLIAGASVIGVAIGFGAQTFVRDVIAGMFYLVDDAFRVGEYIQSNNYKGTVEGFSIRSVRLRHHRGPVYTVPFSLLGAIQNQSRDWVIDKMTVGITYDSDLDKARKLIKQIGQELAQDPEFSPLIIEPLKMQGVEELGDFAIKIRMKMMTLPGEQFVIRRKAYAMVKKAFDENGIKFAFPTVQVTGNAELTEAAAARQSLELIHSADN